MSLDTLIKDFNKKYKDEIAFKGISQIVHPRIPFSSPRANYMLYGGLPRNRMIEFFGDFSCGKTTTALDIVKNSQILFKTEAEGKKVLYVDSEHTLDHEWAAKIGVDINDLFVIQPFEQSAEQIFQMILDAIETGEVGLAVLDSLANLVSQQAWDKNMEEKTRGGISAPLSTFCTKACPLLSKYGTTFLGINQVRLDMNNPYNMYVTPGGQAWKLNCSVRLMFQQGAVVNEAGEEIKTAAEKTTPSGNQIQMRVIKTKICKPNRKLGYYTLMYDYGIDKYIDLFDIAHKEGIIQGSGWYTFMDPSTGEIITDAEGSIIKIQGKKNVISFLKEDEIMYNELESIIKSYIEG